MSELEESSNSLFQKVGYSVCAFISFLSMILVIISVSTTHWLVSTFISYASVTNVTIDASIGFFRFCYAVSGNGVCINLPNTVSTSPGLLIVGILLLALNIIVSLALCFIKVRPRLPVILLSLSSIFLVAGSSISSYYLFSYIVTNAATIFTANDIHVSYTAVASLIQGITAGYSYNLSIAGHFFSYVALAVAVYMSGQARVQ